MLIVYSEKFSIEKISLYVYWFKETDLYTVETICIQKICKLLLLLAKPISHLIILIMQVFIACPLVSLMLTYCYLCVGYSKLSHKFLKKVASHYHFNVCMPLHTLGGK